MLKGITSWQAFLITQGVVFFGFIWSTFYIDAPFKILAATSEILLGIYILKRAAQKHPKLGGNNGNIMGKSHTKKAINLDNPGHTAKRGTKYIPDDEGLSS